jgi:carboxyl-terminal processing protease
MMEALDPYSSFVDAETFRRLNSRQEYGASVGITAAKRYGYAYVVAVHPDSPAAREGIRTGDMIESIEDQVTTQMSLWEVQALFRGPAHSSVELRVIRSRRSQPQRLVLQREPIGTEDVSARIVGEKIGLLRIPHFGQDVELA